MPLCKVNTKISTKQTESFGREKSRIKTWMDNGILNLTVTFIITFHVPDFINLLYKIIVLFSVMI